VKTHLAPELGAIPLTKLSPQRVQAFLNAKLAERNEEKGRARFAPRTVQYMHAVLRKAVGQAERWGLVSRNVAKLVDPPRVRRAEVQPLLPMEAKKFLEATRGDRLEAFFSVATALGLRQAEALGLRWVDVDLDGGKLAIRVSLQRIAKKLELVELKSEKSHRTMRLPRFVVAVLRAHRACQAKEKLLAGSRWQERGLVFTTTIGTPLDRRNMIRRYAELLMAAGVPRKRFHDLRHTAASLLFAQGVKPCVVQEILGHSRIETTMNVYTHLLAEMHDEAAAKMDALLG
jgi:integrase